MRPSGHGDADGREDPFSAVLPDRRGRIGAAPAGQDIVGDQGAAFARVRAARVPVSAARPNRWWLAALDRDSAQPTSGELRMLRSYVDYKADAYLEPYRSRLLSSDAPEDPGHSTVVLLKRGRDDWYYRRLAWDMGYWPRMRDQRDPMSLDELLDRIESIGGALIRRWERWKADHPSPHA